MSVHREEIALTGQFYLERKFFGGFDLQIEILAKLKEGHHSLHEEPFKLWRPATEKEFDQFLKLPEKFKFNR